MTYELKIIDAPGGLQVKEHYRTLTGGTIEEIVLISTALPATLITVEAYELLSCEPLHPMEKDLDFGLYYIPTIPNPKRGLIKGFTLDGKIWGDLPVVVCDCEIGYPNHIILGTDVLMKCQTFSVDGVNVTIEAPDGG